MKTSCLKKVNNLWLEGNLDENWRRFKQNYEIFEHVAGIAGKQEQVKIEMFLNAIGEDAVEIYSTFLLSEADRKHYSLFKISFNDDFCAIQKTYCL